MSDFTYDAAGLVSLGLDEIAALEGRTFSGPWFELDDRDRDAFAAATWLDQVYPDPPPPEFGNDVVEGFLTLGLLDALWNQVMRFDRESTYTMNYGLDRVRFVSPVRVGQRLRLELQVRQVSRRPDGLVVRLGCQIAIDGQDRPGLVADWLLIVRPRGGDRYHTGDEGDCGV
ncbi:MaoC/PaaZ C-terminal domain-containing protein [Nocardioides sp.]|uniref:MaoC/PaaZ C-terminal domain-containing protein n=1 Tax=Nocardioides sp. TaxID=35761 RepID=UPI003784CB49